MNKPREAPTPCPFSDIYDFIQTLISAISLRCRRIAIEHRLADAQRNQQPREDYFSASDDTDSEGDLQQQLSDFQTQEEAAFAVLEAREKAHQADPDCDPLPLHVACQDEGLNDQEKLILWATLLPCLGQEQARAIYEPLDRIYWTGLTTEALVAFLDLADLADRVDARKLFHHDGLLVQSGLVEIAFGLGTVHAEDLWDARVYLTIEGFARVMGDPSLVFLPEKLDEAVASKPVRRES